MTEVKWTISQLERSLPDGTVLTAHWRCSGIDGSYTGTVYGTQCFTAKDQSDPTFVPYEQITEEMALQWVHEAMGSEQVTAHEADVKLQIDNQKNPVSASGTPWSASA